MAEWMYGWMVELMAMAMAIAMAMCQHRSYLSSSEAINCKGTATSTLAATAVTAAYATAAVDPLLAK